MRALAAVAAALVVAVGPATGQGANAPTPGLVRVRVATGEGPITLALDARRAPRTTANFLVYVDDGRFDGTSFYRAARNGAAPAFGFVQGGIRQDARRILPPFPHERTDATGIRHLDATVSMARGSVPGSAGGNFTITVGPAPGLDARGDYPGYAAFGRVVDGMATVRRILAKRTCCGSGVMRGQMVVPPVRLIAARRIDGVARPTGRVKPWLINLRPRAAP